jgi:hypothetical protein
MYGGVTKWVVFGLCIWTGYKLALFLNFLQNRDHCRVESKAHLVQFIKAVTITETQPFTVPSLVTFTTYATVTNIIAEQDQGPGLTHVIIPITFKSHQLAKLARNLLNWHTNPPCTDVEKEPQTTLTILVHNIQWENQQRKLNDMYTALPTSIRRCFKNFEVLSAALSDETDNHTAGSRAMFESVLSNDINLSPSPLYIFLMEADAVPIRPGWLIALQRACRGETFWVKGSTLRHDLDREIITQRYGQHFHYHLNGNAIYNIPQYRPFYFDKVLPYHAAKGITRFAFDVALGRYLLDPINSDVWRQVAHRFQYTQIIQNRWGESYSVTERARRYPETFLIHGGIPMNEDTVNSSQK